MLVIPEALFADGAPQVFNRIALQGDTNRAIGTLGTSRAGLALLARCGTKRVVLAFTRCVTQPCGAVLVSPAIIAERNVVSALSAVIELRHTYFVRSIVLAAEANRALTIVGTVIRTIAASFPRMRDTFTLRAVALNSAIIAVCTFREDEAWRWVKEA